MLVASAEFQAAITGRILTSFAFAQEKKKKDHHEGIKQPQKMMASNSVFWLIHNHLLWQFYWGTLRLITNSVFLIISEILCCFLCRSAERAEQWAAWDCNVLTGF